VRTALGMDTIMVEGSMRESRDLRILPSDDALPALPLALAVGRVVQVDSPHIMHILSRIVRRALPVVALAGMVMPLVAAEANPFVGRWALTIPGGGAGWLGVTREAGYYDASILWGGGSVVPVSSVFFTDDSMYVTRVREVRRRDADGKVIRTQQFTEALIGQVQGDQIWFTRYNPRENGQGINQEEFSGKRIPPLPPQPDLTEVKFGDPIELFNGRNLDGWRLTSPGQRNGWSAKNGLLINQPDQQDGKPRISYGNLRTDRDFEDFQLSLEVNVPPDGNSGVYLRGIYEIQVSDSHGKPVNSHHMGAVYSRITPTASAEKPAGEWQSMQMTLVDRHITVTLNGTTIIDNQPLLGCTGGALWSDESRPGPIYLQGDHTAVQYRNLILRPVVK
jgi:hypothetical protein